MTTKERLIQLVQELTEVEAEGVLRVVEAHRSDVVNDAPVRIELDDAQMADFLDALDHPERFEPGLRRLFERPSALDG
jgi:uncharacterized protein (DUF1778 family)